MTQQSPQEHVPPPEDERAVLPGLRGTLSAFAVPNFRWLFAGRVASQIGRMMRVFLRAWMVLELTDSPLLMGIVVSSLSWPMLVLPFIGGALADRVDRRRLLLWTETLLTILWAVIALQVAMAAFEFGPEPLRIRWWHFIISSFLSGIIQSIGRPGHMAMVGSVVDRRRLPSAVALDSIADTWPGVAGPSLAAGAVWLVGGPWQHWGPWLFGFTSVAQGFTALAIFKMTWTPQMNVSRGRRPTSVWRDFTDSLALVRSHPVLLPLIAMSLVFVIFANGAGFLLPFFARDVLGLGKDRGAAALGLLSTAQTLGSATGAFLNVMLVNLHNRGRLLLVVGLTNALTIAAFSQSRVLILSALLIALSAGSSVFFRTSQRMLLQRFAPDEMRGRIMAMDAFQQGLSPIGVLIWGLFAEVLQNRYGTVVGTQTTWLISGLMYAVVLILFFTFVPALRSFEIGQFRSAEPAATEPLIRGKSTAGDAHETIPSGNAQER